MSRGEHGFIPIPGPAVLQLLSDVAAPVWSGPAPYEMCTPTGAALLATTVTRWQEMPQMRVRTVGHGAGSRDVDEVANIVRLVLGEPVRQPDSGTAVLLESNVDDMDPRLWPDVLAALLTAGASDAWLTPILMKKGRPGYTLHALCAPTAEAKVCKQIFARTSTIGLRRIPVGKYALDREQASVRVQGEQIGVKLARDDGRVVNVSVEYEDVARAAQRLDLPVKEVLRAASAEAHRLFALGSAAPPTR
jgi:uncharacterized protein (DUF111 family)